MVHGAQGTPNHLEPPSEPLATAGGDVLDPVVAQQEGEHNAGSGAEDRGEYDHDDEAAVVEDTADAKDIPTHRDGVEDANQSIEKSNLVANSPNLNADEKLENVTIEDINSFTIPQEDKVTEAHTENAPPQAVTTLDQGAESSTSEDKTRNLNNDEGEGEVVHQEQPAASALEETQLPAEDTDDVSKQVVAPTPEEHTEVAPVEELFAESPGTDPPLCLVDVSGTQSPSPAPDDEGSSAATQAQSIIEASEMRDDEQNELQDELPKPPIVSGDVQQEDKGLIEPNPEGPAEPEDVQESEILAPALENIDTSSMTKGLPRSEDEPEYRHVEPQDSSSDLPLEFSHKETEDAQATADEPIIDSSVTRQDSESTPETPARDLEELPGSDDVGNTEQLQLSDDSEGVAASTLDEPTSIEDKDFQPAASNVPNQAGDAFLENETHLIDQDVSENDIATSEPQEQMTIEDRAPSEAAELEKTAAGVDPTSADAGELAEQIIPNLLPDHQEPALPEPSHVDAASSDDHSTPTAEVSGEKDGEVEPVQSSIVEEAPRQIESEAESIENTSEQPNDVPEPEEHLPEESTQTNDAPPGSTDLETIDNEEPPPASEDGEETPPGPPCPEDGSTAELPDGDFDTLRDSGVSMDQSNDNLSDVTVKIDPAPEASGTIEAEIDDAHDEDHESPETPGAPLPEADVPLQKDEDAILTHGEEPEHVESGEPEPAQAIEIADYQPVITGPAGDDTKSLPQEEVVSQEAGSSQEQLPADDLPESNSDEDDKSPLEDTLATGAVAALVTAAGALAHQISSHDEQEGQTSPEALNCVGPERPRTADKSTGPDETGTHTELDDNQTAAPQGSEPMSSTEMEGAVLDESQQDAALDRDFQPRTSRRDSSTQTEELWRPKTPFTRSVTPAIVLPDFDDSDAKIKSRARMSRTESRRSIQQAEEVVAAAVIIRAAADTLGQTSMRMTDAVKDLKQHGTADDALNLKDGRRGTGDAARSLRDSSANRLAGVDRTSKTDDKPPRSPRQHRSSHGSRSSRPSTRESGSKRHSSHRHRHEGDREVEQGSPQTPPRTRDTAESGHRSRKERTPQEQADHDKRKEERRLAREKSKADSPGSESKGKEAEAPPSIDRRSSRRHSSARKENVPSIASTTRTESTAPPQASKKFFDKTATSVVDGFGGPLTAEISKDGSLKRSSSKTVRRSLSQNQAKLQKVRVEESVKASKDKVDKERPRESRTTSSTPSNGNSFTKDRDDKHRKSRMEKREKEDAANGHKEEKKEKKAGGLKGMFKKLFG